MIGFRWRARTVLALLLVIAVCFSLRHGTALLAKDQEKDKPAKKGTTADKAAKKKSRAASPKSSQSGREDSGDVGGTNATGGLGGGGATSGPGSSAQAASGKSGTAGGGKTNTAQPIAGTTTGVPAAPPAQRGGNPGGAAPPGRLDANHPIVKKVIGIQDRITPGLLQQKGIVGSSTGLDEDGNVVIKVYTTGADAPTIPKQVEGVAVIESLTGPIHPYWQSAFNTKGRQPRPIPIGVSAFDDVLLTGGCASGTLGCRLRDKNGNVYALSNNHVFAGENGTEGGVVIGTQVVNPSPGDNNCAVGITNDVLGALFKFKPLIPGGEPNVIDAAVITTDETLVSNSTPPPPVAYGPPRTTTWIGPFIGLKVQKLGRTSSYTTGVVSAINSIAVVPYTPGLVFFVRQIEFTATNGPSLGAPGDSGSLIVTNDPLGDRFPVALLFAGGGGITLGNPIQDVLDFFDMTIDGDGSPFPSPGKQGRAAPNQP